MAKHVQDAVLIGEQMGLAPYEKILNRYYGGLDVALSPIQVDNLDAYIISYPKCGRTWLKTFLQLLFLRHYGQVQFDGNVFYANDSPKILAVHTGFYYNSKKKTIFIVRDPRDIIVSFYHHVQNRGPATMHKYKKMGLSDFVRNKDLGMPPMIQYYKRWKKRLKKCKQLMLIKYEDMVSQDTVVFNDVHNFLGLNIPIGLFLKTVEFCRFDNIRKELAKTDFGIFANHPELSDLKPASNNPNSAKIRKGIVGGYVDELTADDISYCDRQIKKMPKEWNFYG